MSMEIVGTPKDGAIKIRVFWNDDLIADGFISLAIWDDLRSRTGVSDEDFCVWSEVEKDAST